MGKRRASREIAFQLLYALEISNDDKDSVISRFSSINDDIEQSVWEYALEIVNWTTENKEEIDKILLKIISNWSLDRVSKIDISLIRLGCAEMKWGGVPVNIVVNEIVELAKQFGDKNSSSFVNGVLDSWHNES